MNYQKADGSYDFSGLRSAHADPSQFWSYVWPENIPPSGTGEQILESIGVLPADITPQALASLYLVLADQYWQIHWQDAAKYFFQHDRISKVLYELQDDVSFNAAFAEFSRMAQQHAVAGAPIWSASSYEKYVQASGGVLPERIHNATGGRAAGKPITFSGRLTPDQIDELNAGADPATVITVPRMIAAERYWADKK